MPYNTPEKRKAYMARPEIRERERARDRDRRQSAEFKAWHAEYEQRQERKESHKKWLAKNKTNIKAKERLYRRQHPEKKEYNHKRYFLDPVLAQRRRLAKEQRRRNEQELEAGRPRPDCCDICGNKGTIFFDHCHQKGHFRGWLCLGCNVTLGRVNDSPELLLKMIAYLQRTHVNTSPQLTLPGI